ncbi:hypothetical protein ACJMK2_030910 [Sinanodonta woodiana]|uniref:Uncharacterized protein n=1 Tax=Sinanodonta woodiana TaxID=1069815 RepID=A0ABD3X0Q1_SINWO
MNEISKGKKAKTLSPKNDRSTTEESSSKASSHVPKSHTASPQNLEMGIPNEKMEKIKQAINAQSQTKASYHSKEHAIFIFYVSTKTINISTK